MMIIEYMIIIIASKAEEGVDYLFGSKSRTLLHILGWLPWLNSTLTRELSFVFGQPTIIVQLTNFCNKEACIRSLFLPYTKYVTASLDEWGNRWKLVSPSIRSVDYLDSVVIYLLFEEIFPCFRAIWWGTPHCTALFPSRKVLIPQMTWSGWKQEVIFESNPRWDHHGF